MIKIYTKKNCLYCTKAKELLEQFNLGYTEYNIPNDFSVEELKTDILGLTVNDKVTLPRIFIGKELIGGYSDLEEYLG